MPVSFPQLLDAAERRMHTDESCTDLIQAIARQLAADIQADFVALDAWDGSRVIPVLQIGEQPNTELAVDSVLPGRTIRRDLPNNLMFVQTSATVSGDASIVLSIVATSTLDADDLFGSVIEVVADLYRRRLLERSVSVDANHQRQLRLLSGLHRTLDSEVVANTIATDGAVLTDARTISVARRSGSQWNVTAATGVSHPNDRSDAARRISAAIKEAANGRELDESSRSRTNDEGRVDDVLVRPLNVPPDWKCANWAAVVDLSNDSSDPTRDDHQLVSVLCHHGALALANCDRYAATSFGKRSQQLFRRLTRPRSLIFISAVCAAIAGLSLMTTELRIEAYGELVPSERVLIFAPEDGTIEELNVDDGSDVGTQQPLCILSNEDLEVQMEGLVGNLSATTARLSAIEALKGQPGSAPQAGLLSAEQLELEEKSRSLQAQVSIMQRRMAALTLTATMNGRVYGDRLTELLTHRPVQRGQFLFEVANPHNDWQLELRVSELDIRHVLHATDNGGDQHPAVRYALETSPEATHEAHLKSISASTEVQSDGQLSTLIVVDVGGKKYSGERPGTGVIAYIDCGRRRVGYVWFRKLIEFVQRNVWL